MASLTEEIADALARDAIRAAEELGDENLVTEISRLIGASSTTTQEAFNTAVRVRQSEARARRLLADRLGASWPLDAVRAAPAVAQAAVPAPAAQPSEVQATASQPVAPKGPTASQPSAQARSSVQGVGSALPPTTAAAAKPAAPQPSATPAGHVPSVVPAAKAPSAAPMRQASAGQAGSAPVRREDMPGRTASVPQPAVARTAPEPRSAAPDARQAVPTSPTWQETAPPRSPSAPRPDLAPPAGPTPTRPPGLSEEAAPPPLAGSVPTRPPKPEFHPIETPRPAPPAQSFAAKLALASALPRRTVTPVEPRNPTLPGPDDKTPDGDWG